MKYGVRSSRPVRTEAELKKGVTTHRVATRYSTLWPLLIILGTLLATTTRDLVTFRTLKREVIRENSDSAPALAHSGQEINIINTLKEELAHLAPTDPAAARVLNDFFPVTTTSGRSSTPAASPTTTPNPSPVPVTAPAPAK